MPAVLSGLVWATLLVTVFTQHKPAKTIPKTCLNSKAEFETYFNYLYPWGSDHNGAARMDRTHVSLSNGTLIMKAQRINGQNPASHGGKSLPIKYLSGAVNAKEHFTVRPGGGFNFAGSFQATTTKGTWPAFWLTAVKGWPPEIDMAEWKGSGKISFNTFNTSKQVSSKDVSYSQQDSFHDIRTELRDNNGKDVEVKFASTWMTQPQ